MEHPLSVFLLVALFLAHLTAYAQCSLSPKGAGDSSAAATAEASDPPTRERVKWAKIINARAVPSGWPTWPLRETIAVVSVLDTPNDVVKQVRDALEHDGFTTVTTKDQSGLMRTVHGYRPEILKSSARRLSSTLDLIFTGRDCVNYFAGFSYVINECRKGLLEVIYSDDEDEDSSAAVDGPPGQEKGMIEWLSFFLAPGGYAGNPDEWLSEYSFDSYDGVTLVFLRENYKPKLDMLREAGFEIAEGKYDPNWKGRHVIAYRPGMEDVKDNYNVFWNNAKWEHFGHPKDIKDVQCRFNILSKAAFKKAVEARKRKRDH